MLHTPNVQTRPSKPGALLCTIIYCDEHSLLTSSLRILSKLLKVCICIEAKSSGINQCLHQTILSHHPSPSHPTLPFPLPYHHQTSKTTHSTNAIGLNKNNTTGVGLINAITTFCADFPLQISNLFIRVSSLLAKSSKVGLFSV